MGLSAPIPSRMLKESDGYQPKKKLRGKPGTEIAQETNAVVRVLSGFSA
jgi:hypothetical protein